MKMTEHEQLQEMRCSALIAIIQEIDYRLMWGQVHEARLLIQQHLGDYDEKSDLETNNG